MTLYHFLRNSGINISNNHEIGLGDKIAQKFRSTHNFTPPKISTPDIPYKSVINYPDGFLESCHDLIIQFLTEKNKIDG